MAEHFRADARPFWLSTYLEASKAVSRFSDLGTFGSIVVPCRYGFNSPTIGGWLSNLHFGTRNPSIPIVPTMSQSRITAIRLRAGPADGPSPSHKNI